MEASREIELSGHIIDSGIMTQVFDRVMDLGGNFEILVFDVGKKKTDPSYARLRVSAVSEAQLQEALTINRKAMGEVHPEVASNLFNLGRLNLERGQFSRSEDYYRQALAMDNKFYGQNNPRLADDLAQLGVVLTREKKFSEAESTLRKAVSLGEKPSDPDYWRVAMRNIRLGACLADQRKFKDAEPLLVESYSIIKKQFGQQHGKTREAAAPLIALYQSWGKQDSADAIRAELGIAK